MTNTYSGDPANVPRDAVRFWLNDTGQNIPQTWEFSDEEIAYALTLYPNPILAAAYMANRLAMKYSAAVDKSVGDLRLSYSQRARMYLELAEQLKSQSEQSGVSIYIGGVSRSDMCSVDANSDRVKQPFTIKQFDVPNASGGPGRTGDGD